MPLFWDLSLLLSQHFTNFDILCYHFHSFQNTLSRVLFRSLLFSFKILGNFAQIILLLISNLVSFSNSNPLNYVCLTDQDVVFVSIPWKLEKNLSVTCWVEWSVSWLTVLRVSSVSYWSSPWSVSYWEKSIENLLTIIVLLSISPSSFFQFLLHVFCSSVITIVGSF